MFPKKALSFLVSVFLFAAVSAQNVTAEMQKVKMSFTLDKNGTPVYSVFYDQKAIVQASKLGFILTDNDTFKSNFQIIGSEKKSVDETWKPVWGEVKEIRNHYEQVTVHLKQSAANRLLDIVFRVFADGVGFRYEFPKQPGIIYFIVTDELTQFNLTGNHKAFWIPGDYDTNEYPYTTSKLSETDNKELVEKSTAIAVRVATDRYAVQTPLMLKTADGLYINIHEAALINYPAMQLHVNDSTYQLSAKLVPDALGNKAYLHAPCHTPWRTIIVSDKATDILASKMILNLNNPSENGIKGVLVEGWNTGWEDWFGNWKENVFDFVTPYPDFDVKAIENYAASKGVEMIMHNETSGSATNYERQMDTAFRFMNQFGYKAVKTGYVGKIIPRGEHHDGQWMVNHYLRSIEKAASYHVMIDIHEPMRPTGLQRTWPNFLACEAARGNEYNAFSDGNAPDHETILPFTRLMGGPMDYTPRIFKLRNYAADKTRQVHTTLAKQLALYVTLYSPLQMAADLPENYEAHMDAFQFIKDVPVDWDNTKILAAEPGDYIAIARKGKESNNWFLGAITDENARQLTVDFSFLDKNKKYNATIYADAADADWKTNPEAYKIKKMVVNSTTHLLLKLAPGGGAAVSIVPR